MPQDHPIRKLPIIGLTGGIAAGKSSVARLFASNGAAVIDSDRLAHEALRDPVILGTLRAWWGENLAPLAGDVDRAVLADLVFEDPTALARLEGLLYPWIARRRDEMIDKWRADERIRAVVIDAPKLFEAGVNLICDAVVFVEADRPLRVERVAAERGWTEREFVRREKLQDPLDKKKARADYVIENDSGIDDLRSQVEHVLSSVLASTA